MRLLSRGIRKIASTSTGVGGGGRLRCERRVHGDRSVALDDAQVFRFCRDRLSVRGVAYADVLAARTHTDLDCESASVVERDLPF